MAPPSGRRRTAEQAMLDEDEQPNRRQGRQRPEAECDDESGDGMDVDGQQGADAQLAKKLVRYAISCEYSRVTIKRDGIKERVLGNRGRMFKRVFALAQTQLREVWGMELRELPVREKTSLQEKRQAMKSNSQPKIGSGSYILSSTLPDAYRSPAILKPSKTPSAEEEAVYVAFYTMIVSMIWLSGGELSEQKLRRQLGRLNADQNLSADKTEAVLRKMERQGYVIKKAEHPSAGQDGENSVTWHIGPRAREEIGLDGVMGMVREVYGDTSDDLEKRLRASLGIRDRVSPDEQDEQEA